MSRLVSGRKCLHIFKAFHSNCGQSHLTHSSGHTQYNFVRGISRFAKAEPVALSYTEFWDANSTGKGGDPVLMTHGLLGSKQNWTSIAKAVAKSTKRRVITFDARNHGDSPQSPIHTYEAMSADILQLVDKLGIDKFSLLGHSMGGRAVMIFALQNPKRLEKLIVVDMSPTTNSSDFGQMKGFLDALISINIDPSLNISEGRKVADGQLKAVTSDPALRAFLLTNLVKNNGGFSWKANLRVLKNNLEEIMEFPTSRTELQFPRPTLFIRGENSNYIDVSNFQEVKQIFFQAQLATIKGAGHWPQADNPHEFIPVLVDFLNFSEN